MGVLKVAAVGEDSESASEHITAALDLMDMNALGTTGAPVLKVLLGQDASERFFPERGLLVLPSETVRNVSAEGLAKVLAEYTNELQERSGA